MFYQYKAFSGCAFVRLDARFGLQILQSYKGKIYRYGFSRF